MKTTSFEITTRPIYSAIDVREMTREELDRIIGGISFAPSGLDFDWEFDVRETLDGAFEVRSSFVRPDTNTGEMNRGYGRWERIEKTAAPSAVVKTCWVCANLIVTHELMEAYCYRGVRIFDPHNDLEELALAQFLGWRSLEFDPEDPFHCEILVRLLWEMAEIKAHVGSIAPNLRSAIDGDRQGVIVPLETMKSDGSSIELQVMVRNLEGDAYVGFTGKRWASDVEETPERLSLFPDGHTGPYPPESIALNYWKPTPSMKDTFRAIVGCVLGKNALFERITRGEYDDHGRLYTEP